MSKITPLSTIEMNPSAEACATLIVLHGLGADGADFIPMFDALELAAIGPVRCVMPRAAERAVTVNGGHRMRAWYDISNADLQKREDEAGLRSSVEQIHALLDREIARGIPAHRIVLSGFSQGCAMTLLAGLRYPLRLAGLAGLSGYLPLAGSTAAEAHAANRQTPIFLAHGTRDPVVALSRGQAAQHELQALGYAPEWHEYPMEHSLCMEEVQDLNQWLLRVLAR